MKHFNLLGTICAHALVVGGYGAALAAPALAQEVPVTADASQDVPVAADRGGAAVTSQDETIIITGSRIQRPNLTSIVPVTTVQAEEVLYQGDVSLGDALTNLPALRSTLSQASSGRTMATAGLNVLDLRGLGTTRTLVLVNGRRHITSQTGSFSVDINTIPVDLLERVDIVTGGNSAVYGSDAVAGVVNFITKRDFDGVRMRGQTGISSRGDRENHFLGVTAGKNFADNRANVSVNLEYAKQELLHFTDRDGLTGAFSGRDIFQPNENTGVNLNPFAGPLRAGSEDATGNGVPDLVFWTGVKNNNISDGGLFPATCPTSAAAGETSAQFNMRRIAACSGTPNPASADPLAQLGRTYVFQPDGSLIPNPCVRDLRQYGVGTCIGGLGTTLRRTGVLAPGLTRKSANFLASYEVSPAFRPFIEAKFVNSRATQEGQPSFFFNSMSLANPFLTDQARAQIQSTLAPGQTSFSVNRFNIDLGGMGATVERDTYRAVVGADGVFNDDWRYEIALNYGRLESSLVTRGNVINANYTRAINAVRNGQGNIVCAVNADTNPANDDAACAPLDIFGEGRASDAALDYVIHTSTREELAEQHNVTAFISGDSSQLFELPGGPIAFALGGEYRRDTAYLASDPLTASGATFTGFGPTLDAPPYEVLEAFGEIRVPLLADRPFFEELSIEAAGRLSDYSVGSTGTVFAYNVGANWVPVSGLRFRGGYSKSVRAPTIGNLFTPSVQVFGPLGLQDPCAQQNIANNPNRVRNCTAAGVPTTQSFTLNGVTTTEPFSNRPVSSILGASAGNPSLQEEVGRSISLGMVAQPVSIPGLSLSIDYYDIEITNAIAVLGAQAIIDLCYDDPSGIDNQYCGAVSRNADGTFSGQTTVAHAGGSVSLPTSGASFTQQPFNFAKTETSGIDFDLNYRSRVGDSASIDLRAIVGYVIKRNNFTNVNDPTFSNRQLGELGDPAWRAQFSARLEVGAWELGYRARFIGKQTTANEYEAQHSHQGRPATNPDNYAPAWLPEVLYHDLRLEFQLDRRFRFRAGVDNVLDKAPPYKLITGDNATANGASLYDNVGRYFYAGASVEF